MKTFIISLLFIFSLMSIHSHKLFAYDFGSSSGSLGGQISVPKAGFFDPLVNIYNKLIDLTKSTIDSNMRAIVKSAIRLLTGMAVVYIVVIIAKSWATGSYFFSEVVIKTALFLGLAVLLNFNWFDKYILSNIEILFNNLPTVFNSSGGSVVANIINQTSVLASQIWAATSSLPLFAKAMGWTIAIFSMVALSSLTLIVLLNILLITVEFYFTLSLSSIFLLLFFFKFTRSYAMGAVSIVFGAILKITMLSFFLNLYGGILQSSLSFKGDDDFFSACMGVILISVVGIVLIKVVNEIANRITGGVGAMAGANIPNLMNTAKGLMGGK